MQKLEEAGVGSAVGLARSDLKLVGGSHRDRGPRGRVLGVSGPDRPGNTSRSVTWHCDEARGKRLIGLWAWLTDSLIFPRK